MHIILWIYVGNSKIHVLKFTHKTAHNERRNVFCLSCKIWFCAHTRVCTDNDDIWRLRTYTK